MSENVNAGAPIPFGIRLDTGQRLNGLSEAAVRAMVGNAPPPTPTDVALLGRAKDGAQKAFALQGGDTHANELDKSGWGVVYSAGVSQQIKDALKPLLDHRKAQTGPEYFKVFDGPDGYLMGESSDDWLERNGSGAHPVDPDDGVPFYLLLVGPPDELPFEFQYSLDVYFAVGRLWFDRPDEFRQYAESVIAYEKPGSSVRTSRCGAVFATEHDFDEATQLFTRLVAQPLTAGKDAKIWGRAKFGLQPYLGDDASRDTLADILRGKKNGTPALLMSGTHGLVCPPEDKRQAALQGGIVCKEFSGFGKMKPEYCFSAAELPADAQLQGMIHFFFACYGGGSPEVDNYDRLNDQPQKIADKSFFSRLPQKMLAHPNGGALAVLAHIDRAFASSFQGARGGQIQGFKDVIVRLLNGDRIGQATDSFNVRWSYLSGELSQTQLDFSRGANVLDKLGNLWVARDDARNYMILGDPAVRLRVEAMPEVQAGR